MIKTRVKNSISLQTYVHQSIRRYELVLHLVLDTLS